MSNMKDCLDKFGSFLFVFKDIFPLRVKMTLLVLISQLGSLFCFFATDLVSGTGESNPWLQFGRLRYYHYTSTAHK